VEGRKPEQSTRTSQELAFTSSAGSAPSFSGQPVAADGFVNGVGAHNTTIVTHVDLHHAPEVTHEVVTQQRTTPVSVVDEPEPDYDGKDVEDGSIQVDGVLPRPTEVVGYGPPPLTQPPTPPPLPPPSTLGFSAGRELSLATRVQSRDQPDPAEMAAARQRDEAHAALMAAVQRRRHLLDSVDGELIADSIENRVQRSKMLQTVYRADNAAVSVQRCRSDESAVERQPVGLLSVTDPSTAGTTVTESNGDFTSEAEQARLRYIRRLHPPPPPAKQPPLTKPLRSLPPTAPKSLQNGGGNGQAGIVRTTGTAEPPAVTRRSVVVHESHNRALAAYVNGSSKVYAAAAGTSAGDVDNATRAFVRLNDVGESTTEPSPSTPAAASHDRRLRIVTDDTASVLSSLSTLSTNSSGGVGVVDGAGSPHGSPSQSSSGDSGFAKSSITTSDGAASRVTADQPIIPPPTEFASLSDNTSSSSSSTSVQTTVTVTALRSVARNQSHSMLFPARTQVTQK